MGYALVLFHENLRLSDNAALNGAVKSGDPVVPLYVLDDETPGDWRLGGASRWWLHHSLEALSEALEKAGSKLVLRKGRVLSVVEALLKSGDVTGVYFERTYAPWSSEIEEDLKDLCAEHEVVCKRYGGHLLFEPESIRTQKGEAYSVFSPFWRACQAADAPSRPAKPPKDIPAVDTWPESDDLDDWQLLPQGVDWAEGLRKTWMPGEEGALKRLDAFLDKGLAGYKDNRDNPAVEGGTSMLSPHLRFGEISPRTLWWRVKARTESDSKLSKDGMHFLRELAWRDFSYHLLVDQPELPRKPLRENFADFPWKDQPASVIKKWQKGNTGYPIVDAGMRQLWQTGYMHNRVRMIVASFLVKDLLVNWHVGEDWFWDTLVDADIANNSASWQWVAGCGADAAPYFRIFNPVLQGEKFDPKGEYVRRYVPEIADLPDKYIHKPWEAPDEVLEDGGVTLGKTYPEPMVDRKRSRQRALDAYDEIKKAS